MPSPPESTCWTVVRAAAAGSAANRDELARRYLGVVRASLGSRWRGSPLSQDLEDAVQEVFVECFREGGALQAVGNGRVPHFRAFLFGVVRNIARRFESRPARAAALLTDVAEGDAGLSRVFDRKWAEAIMVEAAQRQRTEAAARGNEALQRVELLRLRFEEGLPIRDIAARWGVDAARLHHDYALARQEFRTALLEVIAFHHPASPAELENEAAALLKALS
ncbi:MAG: RNA polymerase sigma factor [Pirellulaceae bacterium]